MRVVFFGSSSFVIPILKDLDLSRNLSLLQVLQKKTSLNTLVNSNISEIYSQLEKLIEESDFIGSEFLEKINSKIELVGIVTQADTLHRGKLQQSEVALFANQKNVKLFQPEKIKNQVQDWNSFIENNLDVAIVSSYGQILSQEILNSAKISFLNWHPSKLPMYRGPSPMQQTIADGSKQTALSWIKMEKGMDSGDIYLQIPVEIKEGQNFLELAKEMGEIGSQTWPLAVLSFLLQQYCDKTDLDKNVYINNLRRLLPKIVQNNDTVTFTKMLNKDSALVDISYSPANEIYQHFLGFIQYPKTSFYSQYFKCNVRLDIVLGLLELSSNTSNLLKINEEWFKLDTKTDFMLLRCKNESYLKVQQITLEGGKKINLKGFQF